MDNTEEFDDVPRSSGDTPEVRAEELPSRAVLRRALALLVVVVAFTMLTLVVVELTGGAERFRAAVEGAGSWAPVVYVLLKTATYVVAPMSGTTLKLGSGAIFGTWEGMALTLVGDTLGGSLNYWIARTLGRKGVQRFVGTRALSQIEWTAERVGGWRALLAGRLLLSSVYDFISYAVGLARIPYPQYLAVTILGGFVPALFFAAIGDAAVESRTITYVVIAVSTVAVVLIGIAYAIVRGRGPGKGAKSMAKTDHRLHGDSGYEKETSKKTRKEERSEEGESGHRT